MARQYAGTVKLVLFQCFAALCYLLSHAAARETGVVGGCQMSWMSPSTILLDGLTTKESRLAAKYSLHLYREREWDRGIEDGLHGIPVLFIPGNAGSYRQVRSLASAAARHFYAQPGKVNETLWQSGHRNLDFFALDFNEDFSALHGETLAEQAEYARDSINYILTLYRQFPAEEGYPHPDSVILIGHSMGGIVARQALLLEGILPEAVNTLITLSTPHLMPPAPFDSKVEAIYSTVNSAWPDHMHPDLALVSISGGEGDTMIPSDTASLVSVAPPSNALSLFTTGVPHLWAPVDHQAMVWCHQLRQSIVLALFDLVDNASPSKTRSLETRMSVFRSHLLGESSNTQVYAANRHTHVDVQLPQSGKPYGTLRILTSEGAVEPQVCSKNPEGRDECQPTQFTSIQALPASYMQHTTTTRDALLWDFTLSSSSLQNGELLRLAGLNQNHLLLHAFESNGYSRPELGWSLTGMASFTHTALVPSRLFSSISLPLLDSSLAVYHLRLRPESVCETRTSFAPLIRARSAVSSEAHYFPNAEDLSFHLHESSPFLPPFGTGVVIDIWKDPQCSGTAESQVLIALDLGQTLLMALHRYRLIFLPWASGIVFSILAFQKRYEQRPGTKFASLYKAWAVQEGPYWLGGLTLAAGLQQQALVQGSWPLNLYALILGSKDLFAVFLAPLFFTLSVLFVGATALCLELVVKALSCLSPAVNRLTSRSSKSARFASHSLLARFVPLFSLAAFVIFIAPQQFAFIVFTVMILLHISSMPTGIDNHSFVGLLLLVTIVPVNGSILIVWTRNLAANWNHPFTSDHNIFNCLGVLMWYEALHKPENWAAAWRFNGTTYSPKSSGTLMNKRWLANLPTLLARMAAAVLLLCGGRYTSIAPSMTNVYFLLEAAILAVA